LSRLAIGAPPGFQRRLQLVAPSRERTAAALHDALRLCSKLAAAFPQILTPFTGAITQIHHKLLTGLRGQQQAYSRPDA
jgi:hypothetical protein